MSHIISSEKLDLEFTVDKDTSNTMLTEWSKSCEDKVARFLISKVKDSSGINSRQATFDPLKSLSHRSLTERMAFYKEKTRELSLELTQKIIKSSNVDIKSIDFIVSTSCTGFQIPNFNSHLINTLEFKKDVISVPISLYGCTGWTGAMIVADNLIKNTNKTALVLNLELSSNVAVSDDFRPDNIISTVIFADGVSGHIITSDQELISRKSNSLKIIDSKFLTIEAPDSAIGYRLTDKGFQMDLSKEVPELIKANYERSAVELLDRNNLKMHDINHFLVHPGGLKILNDIDIILEKYKKSCFLSRDVFESRGNMSSATLGHIVEKSIKDTAFKSGDFVLASSFGPGFTVHNILMKYV